MLQDEVLREARDGLLIFRKITLRPAFDDAKTTLSAIVDGSKPIVKAVMLPNG
jgi:hypothetical protein